MQPCPSSVLRRQSQRALRVAVGLIGAAALSACGSLSGFGGSASLTCKLPTGAHCDSMSNTYSDSLRGELPGQIRNKEQQGNATVPNSRSSLQGGAPTAAPRNDGYLSTAAVTPGSGVTMPLRSQSRVLRIWVKAWEDSDGDLHDQSFVYIPVDESRWMVEHKQRQVREAYAPSRTMRPVNAGPGDTQGLTAASMSNGNAAPATVSMAERDAAQKAVQQSQGGRRGY